MRIAGWKGGYELLVLLLLLEEQKGEASEVVMPERESLPYD